MRVVDVVQVRCVLTGVQMPRTHLASSSSPWPMPALLPGPVTRSPRGAENVVPTSVLCKEVSPKMRVAEAMHIEEGDAQVVYVGFVWAPFLCFSSLASLVGFLFLLCHEVRPGMRGSMPCALCEIAMCGGI
jgi:hypothetical protein